LDCADDVVILLISGESSVAVGSSGEIAGYSGEGAGAACCTLQVIAVCSAGRIPSEVDLGGASSCRGETSYDWWRDEFVDGEPVEVCEGVSGVAIFGEFEVEVVDAGIVCELGFDCLVALPVSCDGDGDLS